MNGDQLAIVLGHQGLHGCNLLLSGGRLRLQGGRLLLLVVQLLQHSEQQRAVVGAGASCHRLGEAQRRRRGCSGGRLLRLQQVLQQA